MEAGPNEPDRPEHRGALGELIALLARGGRWWMVPLIVSAAVLLMGMILMHAIEYVAPFVYVAQ